jgi:hypothetical protein
MAAEGSEKLAKMVSESTEKWVPLSLTLVEYPEGIQNYYRKKFINQLPRSPFRRPFRQTFGPLQPNALRHPGRICRPHPFPSRLAHGEIKITQKMNEIDLTFWLQIFFCMGTAVNEVLNIILKHIFCEARPLARNSLYTEYGMPSSHSQFMWFFATYCALFILIRYHIF